MVPIITSEALARPGVQHGFFTRQGGVSQGMYASLNGGLGSHDDIDAVLENRHRMASTLHVATDHLLSLYQVHSADIVTVTTPWALDERPRADGMVTRIEGLALAIGTADCGPVLFADAEAGVIGACHAGWKGAFTGVLEATLDAMVAIGAMRSRIVAVLGPTISARSYEVGAEFVARFEATDARYLWFFSEGGRKGHHQFDLPGFIGHRLNEAGLGRFVDLALCTYADEERFYSYRRTTHRGEADYGRLIAAIALNPR